MDSSTSCTLVFSVVSGQSASCSKEKYQEQARVVFAKIPVRYQGQGDELSRLDYNHHQQVFGFTGDLTEMRLQN